MKKKLFILLIISLILIGTVRAVDVTFTTSGTGTAGLSSEQYHSADNSAKLTTTTTTPTEVTPTVTPTETVTAPTAGGLAGITGAVVGAVKSNSTTIIVVVSVILVIAVLTRVGIKNPFGKGKSKDYKPSAKYE